MRKTILSRKAQSTFEFIAMLIFIIGAFLVFQKYIAQGMAGRWKGVGDSFGQGKVYSESKTKECAFDYQYFNKWYDVDCFDTQCDCKTVQSTDATCKDCIQFCAMSQTDLNAYCPGICAVSCNMNCSPWDFVCINAQNVCISNCVPNCIATHVTYDYCN